MKFDKNSVIGITLLAFLFIGYFYFTRQGQLELEAKQKHIADSLAALQPVLKSNIDSTTPTFIDTAKSNVAVVGSMIQNGSSTETIRTLENDLVKINFTNKGARPASVELKRYKSADSSDVKLMASNFNKIARNKT